MFTTTSPSAETRTALVEELAPFAIHAAANKTQSHAETFTGVVMRGIAIESTSFRSPR